ncbi:MAG: hypothetical protein M3533_12360 [Actinomycetota bacterium]|nr:hypothetical protein [Actinomycetota bacterium]
MLFVVVFVFTLTVAAGVAFAVTKNCTGGECIGTSRSDTIYGSNGPDTVRAGAGNDKILGREGDDRLFGDRGNDRVNGGEGTDTVKGSTGTDTVMGGPGNDLVRGGTHKQANDGARDILYCGDGEDTVHFVRGQDVIKDCEIKNPPE